MKKNSISKLLACLIFISLLTAMLIPGASAQSGRNKKPGESSSDNPNGPQKKNKRPDPASEPVTQEAPPKKIDPAETVRVSTNLVPIEATVVRKKTNQQIRGLKQKNFAIFVDGVQQEITYFFVDPNAPVTVAVVVEFSKLGEIFGFCGFNGCPPPYGQQQIPGKYEVLEPMRIFLSSFIRPPADYVSVTGFDMRPTPITDFTNNPAQIQQATNLMYMNNPAFTETNLFDALKLTLEGGIGDSVVLEDSKNEKTDYAGISKVEGRHRAVLLIASGIDTFSKINYGDAMKIVQSSGVPVYIIHTGRFFYYRYGERMDPGQNSNISGIPIDRMTFLQSENAMKTFAKESGGLYYPLLSMEKLPQYFNEIDTALRNQYSLGYNPGDVKDGKKHIIEVRVDVDGDGQFGDKDYEVVARKYYNSPKLDKK